MEEKYKNAKKNRKKKKKEWKKVKKMDKEDMINETVVRLEDQVLIKKAQIVEQKKKIKVLELENKQEMNQEHAELMEHQSKRVQNENIGIQMKENRGSEHEDYISV